MTEVDRRTFTSLLVGSVAHGLVPGHVAADTPPSVDGERVNAHLTALSVFGRNPQGGVSRVAYSPADLDARKVVLGWMREASLKVTVDLAGNIVGRRAGSDPSLKPLVFGSHIDSVPEGGNFDGNVGSLAAIEVAQVLAGRAIRTRHPLEVVIWTNEEGGLFGSRAWSGQLEALELALVSASGLRIDEGIRKIGGDPARLAETRRTMGDNAAYFELHIEQGGILEATATDIGVVEGIVGIRRWNVTVTGMANHAGTTPMPERHDALVAAARFIDMVERVVRSEPGTQVGTVGRIQAFPGAPNVVPGKVECSLELRDLDDAKIERVFEKIRGESERIGSANQTAFAFEAQEVNVSAKSDPKLREIVSNAAATRGLSTRSMPSGAGHDAQAMARLGPMAMIFVPSVGGISHSPKEFTKPVDIVNGANVLLDAVLAADRL
jgi:N-carbamoyl-L-amino-acid hydrolase